jgi:hypothetical protein
MRFGRISGYAPPAAIAFHSLVICCTGGPGLPPGAHFFWEPLVRSRINLAKAFAFARRPSPSPPFLKPPFRTEPCSDSSPSSSTAPSASTQNLFRAPRHEIYGSTSAKIAPPHPPCVSSSRPDYWTPFFSPRLPKNEKPPAVKPGAQNSSSILRPLADRSAINRPSVHGSLSDPEAESALRPAPRSPVTEPSSPTETESELGSDCWFQPRSRCP